MEIKFIDLGAEWDEIKEPCLPKIEAFLEKGDYIGTAESSILESHFSAYCKTDYAVAVSSGQEAIKLGLAAMEIPEETPVIIPANTYIACILPITQLKLTPILIDCDIYYQMNTILLENWLENYGEQGRNKIVIMPVHMTGHPSNLTEIYRIAQKFHCRVLEDCSQAHGAETKDNIVGRGATAAVYSCQPTKNLGAVGEAGIITTHNIYLRERIKQLRNRGLINRDIIECVGWNNRINNLQAVVLTEKLKFLDKWNESRRKNAAQYKNELSDCEKIFLPMEAIWCRKHVYHNYIIRVLYGREKLQQYLLEKGIPTNIHYPIPIQKMKPYKHLNINNYNTRYWSKQLLSLPIHPYLQEREISYICDTIKGYYK